MDQEEFLTLKLYRRPGKDWDGFSIKTLPYLAITCEECGFSSEQLRWNCDLAIKEMEQHQIVEHSRSL